MIIELDITDRMIKEAEYLRQNMPNRPKDSITDGKGTVSGCLGEIAVRDYLNQFDCNAKIASHYEYDIVTKKGTKFEVKTKRCTSKPKPHYECSVPDYNNRQKCDYYVFVRVDEKRNKAYLLGFILRQDFLNKAEQKFKGEKDNNLLPNGKPFVFHANCKNIAIKELTSF